MRREKDEEKVISPMFPRVHVNDTERGGPRAPPRNKMALYEQLTIPSQQLLTIAPNNGVSPTSSSTIIHAYSSTGANLNNVIIASHDSTKPKDYQSSDPTMPFQSVAKCHPPSFSNFRSSSHQRNGGEKVVVAPAKSSIAKGIVDLNLRQNGIDQTGEKSSLSANGSSDLKHRSFPDAMNKRHESDAHLSQESPNLRDKTTLLEARSESSMAESASVLGISPDVVVGVMGETHFWKARRAIVNQQRAFTAQVFELHRLIKVQRMIVASPHLLLQDNLSSGKPSPKGRSVPKLSSYPVPKPKDALQNPNPETQCIGEGAFQNLPLPSYGQPAIPTTKPPPPCWLVPVMSPSEGFVYKPLIAPVFGNGDFLNPRPHFPPYPMPVMSSSAVEHRSSQTSRAMTYWDLKREFSCEMQGSTGSSPSSRVNGGEARALPLFPLASDLNAEAPRAGGEVRAKVIKVVPHNPKLASESAARIFQFIQEERKQVE